MWQIHDSRHCECWAAIEFLAPHMVVIVIGSVARPPNM